MADDYAGQGPAGATSVAVYSSPGKVTQYTAAYWSMATKAVLRDENGVTRAMHWVDQAVALALGVTKGTHKSAPELGNDLRLIPRNSQQKLQTAAQDSVNRALKDLTDRQDIVLLRVETQTPQRSQLIVIVTYINRRLTPEEPTSLQLTFT